MNEVFRLDETVFYLNHAAVSPWPVRTAKAVAEFAEENTRVGSQHYPAWMKVEHGLRIKLAKLINAASFEEIALLKNTSEALSFVAYGLHWQAGDNVIIPAEEFPSNHLVWHSLKDAGVEVREVAITSSDNPEALLIAAMDERTRVLSCSSVQYASGFRLDLTKLGVACKQDGRNVLFCIDAIQSIGALAFDALAYKADFVVADGHKWMMAPEGLALFYCRKALITELKLHEFGWRMFEHPGEFDRKDNAISATASRFECGSPNMTAIHALDASVDVIFEVGIETIEKRVLANTGYLIEQLQQINGCEILSKLDTHRRSGIITFKIKGVSSEQLYKDCMSRGLICAYRGGGVRFSPHFYIDKNMMDKAIEIVKELI